MADEGLPSLALTETGVANQRVLTDAQWLANLHAVQALHGIEASAVNRKHGVKPEARGQVSILFG